MAKVALRSRGKKEKLVCACGGVAASEGAGARTASWANPEHHTLASLHPSAEFLQQGRGCKEKWKKEESVCVCWGWSSHTHDVTPAHIYSAAAAGEMQIFFLSFFSRAAGSGAEREREMQNSFFFFIFHTPEKRKKKKMDRYLQPIYVCAFP